MTTILAASLLLVSSAEIESGYASKYDPGVFNHVVRHRLDNNWWRNPLPHNWYVVAGYAATNDCAQVGQVIEIRPANTSHWSRVLVGDCAGNDGTPEWMTTNNILVELDHDLYTRWVRQHGRPLAVELKP